MKIAALLEREAVEACIACRDIIQIRVTADALPGSPVALSLTPERVRQHALVGYTQGVIADLRWQDRTLEIIMHPDDWRDVLVDAELTRAYAVRQSPKGDTRLMGIPVTFE